MTQPDIKEILRRNLTLTGDGNIVGNNNNVTVIKQTAGDYAIQIGELHLNLSADALLRLLRGADYTPPEPPDPDTLPEPGSLPPGARLPFARNALFTGREAALHTLAQALLYTPQPTTLITQAIHGIGGIGKTQLAVEFTYRYGRFFHGVHWINAAQPDLIPAEIAACGAALALPHWPETQPEQVACTLDAWARGGPRLIILDNLEDLTAARTWLPRLAAGPLRLLLTARRSDWPADLGLSPLPLELFTPGESRTFLRKYLPPERATGEDLDALAERLGHLPLALELAGRYLQRKRRLTIPDYLEKLTAVLAHPAFQSWRPDYGSPTTHDLDLAATFAISWEQLTDPGSHRLFLVAGDCAPNQPIPCALLQAAAELEEESCDDALQQLTSLGLLQEKAPQIGPAIHPLLAEYARTLLPLTDKAAPQEEAWNPLPPLAGALATLSKEALDTGLPAEFQPLHPHLEIVAPAAEAASIIIEEAGDLWNSLGSYLYMVADYVTAQAAFERALQIDEQAFGPNHPAVARDINNLGGVLHALGNLPAAQAAFERALQIDEQALGPNHPKVATDVNNLGNVLQALGDLPAAKVAFERALQIDEQALGSNHPAVANRVNNLGRVLHDLGDLPAAKAAFERALQIDAQAFGPNHPAVARDVNNLGRILHNLGYLSAAQTCYERALQIDEQAFGPHHPNIAGDINNIGMVCKEIGDLPAAQAAFERALQIDEQVFGPNHPNVAGTVNNLGGVLHDLGNLLAAKAAFERALQIAEQAFGPNHPEVATNVNNLGNVLHDLGDLPAARTAYERALQINEQIFGPNHPNVATDVNNLGRVLHNLGDLPAAQAAYERALEILQQTLPPDHPHIRTVQENLKALESSET